MRFYFAQVKKCFRLFYDVFDVAWVLARWIILWGASSLLKITGVSETVIISLGNTLFCGFRGRDRRFNSYESYVANYPVGLSIYGDNAQWREMVSGKIVLDLGSGLGQYSAAILEFNPISVIGVECQPSKIEFAQKRWESSKLEFREGFAEQIPAQDSSVDFVFSHTVFEHIRDLKAALFECHRVLAPGGLLLIGFNHIHHRGGHHLFPYIRFPWPLGIVSEKNLCRYWSDRLMRDMKDGLMGFYGDAKPIQTLSEGGEIHLNKVAEAEFVQFILDSGLILENSSPCELYWTLSPRCLRNSRFRKYLRGTIVYRIRRPSS